MKKLVLIIWLFFVMGSVSVACDECDKYYRKYYNNLKYEQKYRFPHQVRELRHNGRLRLIRAKQWQKERNRYYRSGRIRSLKGGS